MEKGTSQISTRIAVLGPESSGKTTLCEFLADTHGAVLVEEYAREYLDVTEKGYSSKDLICIAQEQFKRNSEVKGGLVVCDTEMITIELWYSEKFSEAPKVILDLAQTQQFDHYLLCRPDFPWEEDPLRENPKDRDRLFSLYLEILEKGAKPYHILEGPHSERVQKVEHLLSLSR
jgi:nicotinamide riboside kinase